MPEGFEGRIFMITGHYGSGKTELAVSLAMLLAGARRHSGGEGPPGEGSRTPEQARFGPPGDAYPRLALVDLDIVNPYFRSRERTEMLEKAGVAVYGGAYGGEITAEIPELSASVRAPLEDPGCRVILDVGGNGAGAQVLAQFRRDLAGSIQWLVVNANRPETAGAEGVLKHLEEIRQASGFPIRGLINNTHMLRETTADDLLKGRALCREVERRTGIPLLASCYPEGIVRPRDIPPGERLIPLGLYMRQSWLDHPV